LVDTVGNNRGRRASEKTDETVGKIVNRLAEGYIEDYVSKVTTSKPVKK
jgi:hypothetical protein